MHLHQAFFALALSVVISTSVAAQQSLQVFTVGSEFQVNTYATGVQGYPAVGVDAVGNFVVVWDGLGSGDSDLGGIFGQRFTSAGTALGTEFQVNSFTTSAQFEPAVAVDADGDFVVVWSSIGEDGDGAGIVARRYASSGSPAAVPFVVNSHTVGSQYAAAVAGEANGDFVVAWVDYDGYDGDSDGVFGRRYTSAGAALGTQFRVNSHTTSRQGFAAVTSDSDGDFVVVWGDYLAEDGDAWGVFGQRYNSSGSTAGAEFQINTYTTGNQGWYHEQAVAADLDGDFVVVWGSDQVTYPQTDVFGQRYLSSATKRGTEFQVNTYTTNYQGALFEQDVAVDGAGNFLVVWASDAHGADTDDRGVFAQARLNSGVAMGTEFLVNTYTTAAQIFPAVSANLQGDFVAVWEDDSDHDGASAGVFGQRYVFAYELKSQAVGAGGTYGTDAGEGNGATSADLVETSVTSPNAGTVTVTERPLNANPPRGYGFIGQQVNISAPAATAGTPLRIVFEIKAAAVPAGQNFNTIQISRDGVTVPNCVGSVTTCAGGPTTANPSPACVSSRCIQGDLDVQVTVLTSSASVWDFSVPCVGGFTKGLLAIKETVPGKEKLIAKLMNGPALTQADFGDPVASGGPAYRLRVYDEADTLVGDIDVDRAGDTSCSGGSKNCWKSIGTAPYGKGYTYKDTDRGADGVGKILLKASPSGAKMSFKAKGPTPPFLQGMPAALLSTSAVTIEVHKADALVPQCFSMTLTDIKKQESDAFKAK